MPEGSDTPLTALELALVLSRQSADIVASLDEALFALSQKRSTLEEKAISRYFHQLVSCYGNIMMLVHNRLINGNTEDKSWLVTLESLQNINKPIKDSVEDLLKIIRYNLNFLEQYYEYDYASKLTAESGYLSGLENIAAELAK